MDENMYFAKHREVSEMRETCRLCANMGSGQLDQEPSPWDCVILQTPNFTVLPTVGAIVEGWLLVIPKDHYLCLGALSNELLSELQQVREFVSAMLQECYGPIAVFEHGPAQPKQLVGCGVDHAHLHVVPTSCDLVDGLRQDLQFPLEWRAVNGVQDAHEWYAAGLSYLYVEQPLGEAYIASHPRMGSQLFRKVIGRYAGRPESYDWRKFPERENVTSTICTLETWLSENGAEVEKLEAAML